ncbi:MAG: aldehyde dehydrogenase family protein, partial [Solirubrobacterales bacterium]
PFLVFEDADLDAAVDGALLAKMRNGGEACTSANRFIVHEAVAAAFTDKLAAKMGAMKVGRGTEDGVEAGPLIDQAAVDKVQELVQDALDLGASAPVGGAPLEGPGYFYPPTVIAGVPDGARITAEEIFGPVAPVRTFATDEEAIAMANDTEYGLVSYVYGRDIGRAFRVMEGLDTGMIGFNQGMVSNAGAPFGGVKQSGYGREGGHEGLEEYLETKYVALNIDG